MVAVTVLGPESTGKTTLAAALAARLGAEVSGEAARAYALALGGRRPLGVGDVGPIARAQMDAEDAAAGRARAAGHPVVVRDTDLVSTAAYAWWYYRLRAAWLDELVAARRAAHYLLCDTDLPWAPDPARDPAMREGATRDAARNAFVATLERYGCAWSWVRGRGDARTAGALAALRPLGIG